MRLLTLVFLLVLLAVSWSSFLITQADPVVPDTKTAKAAPSSDVVRQVSAGVATIVFIDKEDPCPCTEKRIKSSWKALQSALKDRKDIRVTRIHYDTEAPRAEHYTALKPLMVIPGIYFVNGQGKVLALLQGEVKLDEITAVLKKNAPTT
jgi:hypothetical protein